ncbi:MAG TPA: hypothetical protein VIY72_07465 [Acidimicrobiales bacterium]
MFSIGYVAEHSSGPPQWVELLVATLVVSAAAYLGGRLIVVSVARRVRRSDVVSAAVVSEIVTSAVGGEDPDVIVMRAAYELRHLLDLADCRWAWSGDPLPIATLVDDGSIRFGEFRWPIEREGLPPRGIKRELVANGHSFGWIVLVPAGPHPVPLTRLRSAATTIDVLALCFDQHRHPVLPGPSV